MQWESLKERLAMPKRTYAIGASCLSVTEVRVALEWWDLVQEWLLSGSGSQQYANRPFHTQEPQMSIASKWTD